MRQGGTMFQGVTLPMGFLTAFISTLRITGIPITKLLRPLKSQPAIPGNKTLATRRQMCPFKLNLHLHL